MNEPRTNTYIFDVKYSNIERLVQSNPVMARTYSAALTALYSINNVDAATLTAVRFLGIWHNDVTEPTKYDLRWDEDIHCSNFPEPPTPHQDRTSEEEYAILAESMPHPDTDPYPMVDTGEGTPQYTFALAPEAQLSLF